MTETLFGEGTLEQLVNQDNPAVEQVQNTVNNMPTLDDAMVYEIERQVNQ